MQHFIINLERAEERRRKIVAEFQACGLEFEILKAIDHRTLGEEEIAGRVDKEARRREGRRPLSDGMIACALSHRMALQRIAEDSAADSVRRGDTAVAAVFEDDVTLAPETSEILDAIESLEHPFDIIFLHRTRRPFRETRDLIRDYRLGHERYSGWGLLGYVVTRKAASRLLEFEPRVVHQIDHSLHSYWRHGLETLTLDPAVVCHRDEEKSFIYESGQPPRAMNPATWLRRIRSSLTEEIRKRWMFRKMIQRVTSPALHRTPP